MLLAVSLSSSTAQDFVSVRLQSGADLRSVSQQYLNNPDLWPVILSLNGISDIADISELMEIRLPVDQVRLSEAALEASLGEIQKANDAGAQIFAPILIRNAIDYRDGAVVENSRGMYSESISQSSKSIESASAAREQSEVQRDVEAEARLNDKQGVVEGQKAAETSWSERFPDAILNEQEKLRTLSRSTALVVFRDASRLRLNPNSQAVIQRMRNDPLNRREEASISLVEGNFYALLGSDGNANQLQVNLPNVDARVESGNVWVSSDDESAKFSNYDEKPVEISAGDQTVVLGRNEGAVIRNGQASQDKIQVLDRIGLLAPEDDAILYGGVASLAWQSVERGGGYWLEVALDPRFDRMADSQFGIPDSSADSVKIDPGVYFWRVAALDQFGLPGQMSDVRRFEMRDDSVPPFLRILEPQPDAVLRKAELEVTGETEPGASVTVNGLEATVDGEGRYTAAITLGEGANQIAVSARDPAGNVTDRTISATYLADSEETIAWSAQLPRDASGMFLSAKPTITLSGSTAAEARIAALGDGGALLSESYSDAQGGFVMNVPVANGRIDATIRVTAVSGHSFEEAVTLAVLDTPPRMRIVSTLPSFTAQEAIQVEVEAQDGATVTLNSLAGENVEGKARFALPLKEGDNLLEFIATNPVGLVTILKRNVVHDAVKPTVEAREIRIDRNSRGEVVTIQLAADDPSGVAKTSRFRITVEGKEVAGMLRFNRASGLYTGNAPLPARPDGAPLRIEFEVADIAGNISLLEVTR
jgi:hypothetical protein